MRVRSIRNIAERDVEKINGAPVEPPRTPRTALTEAEAAQYIGMSAAWLKKSRTRRFRGTIDAPPFVRAGAKRKPGIACQINESRHGHCNGLENEP